MYAAGAAAVALAAAYCVYFDQKRRSAPDYKNKLRERTSLLSLLSALFTLLSLLFSLSLSLSSRTVPSAQERRDSIIGRERGRGSATVQRALMQVFFLYLPSLSPFLPLFRMCASHCFKRMHSMVF